MTMAEAQRRRLADFEGAWELTREIRHDAGAQAVFAGEAIWIPDEAGLLYRETGTLTVPGGAPMQAERRYLWRAGLRVYFEDGRFFHQVPATGGTAEHWCDPDAYTVCYDFSDWPAFSTVWRVEGPRKRYEMSSRYRRHSRNRA
ncbi:DUF6314 family protein [Roseobacter sinensis]|uniref:DUF6314 family protein n=1 Tax=Roseobacter sinensis TaxID=2931391 RepID=A0ABT3BCP1_9RHOB|nr:DUF6314 family protein [Roseobacter sp. WL0113]MCV3271179.1 DUF6314 family protein [Roseobacter sp. WL0113]